ncbi:hypothetical protein BH23ACT9_BH23ACT9_18120 [soil metagenome]
MQPNDARRNLAYLRLGLGAMWLTPRLGAKIFGLDPDQQTSVKFLARLFAVRDVALGAALLQAGPADADRQVDLGIMVDAADLAAIVMAGARREIGARTVLLGGAAAGTAVVLGLLGRDADR